MPNEDKVQIKQSTKYSTTMFLSIMLFAMSIVAFYYGYKFAKEPILAVLLFHEVVPNPEKPWETTEEHLEEIIDKLISNKYNFVDPEQFEGMLNFGFKGRNVMITFDDGLEKQIKAIKTLYEKYKIRSVVFLLEDKINKPEYMTMDTILDLAKNYKTFFGVHGRYHEKYTEQIANGRALGQITEETRLNLSKALGRTITWLSFPFGDYNRQIIEEIKTKTAIKLAFTIDSGNINVGDDHLQLNRYMYQANDTETKIDEKITCSLLPPQTQENGRLLITISILVFMFGMSRLLLALNIYRNLKEEWKKEGRQGSL